MSTQAGNNSITLVGRTAGDCLFSHTAHGERFWTVPMETVRLSGQKDLSNVIIAEKKLPEGGIGKGDCLAVSGQLRSYNNKTGTGSKLVITVYAQSLERCKEIENYENTVYLSGNICKPPIYRKTPLGREICDLMIAVKRRCARADYLPCIAWGAQAKMCAELAVGSEITIKGRFQSRTYIKKTEEGEEERMAFEISIISVEISNT